MTKTLTFVFGLLLAFPVFALEGHGSPKAKIGGTLNYNLNSAPTTLNPLSSTDYYATLVHSRVLDTLLNRDQDTLEWVPGLATEWEIKDDGMVFEFTLREGVKWHDGKPFSAEDVKFSYDAIMDKDNKYKTAHLRPYFENIKSIEIIGKNKVRATMKEKYFRNFQSVAQMDILPKHVYENPSKKQQKKLNKTVIGTGPYKFKSFKRSRNLTLERNDDWWGFKTNYYKGAFNYGKIRMKFAKDPTIALTMLEKGELDYDTLRPEDYVLKTNNKKWGTEVFKKKVQNKQPVGYSFIAFNLDDPLFKSKKVRWAMAHLVNRDLMIEKFLFDMAEKATGPWYRESDYANKDTPPIEFSPKKALSLLRDEGWADTDGDKVLDKKVNGQSVPFRFTILLSNKAFEKYLTIWKEDAKKIGVIVDIKLVEWQSFVKLLHERKFQAVTLRWSAGALDRDPKQIFHSDSIANEGSNFVGYKNETVDELIDKARGTMERDKRIKILQRVYDLIAQDAPYVFLFNSKYILYAHRKRIKTPRDTLKYDIGSDYWWIEE